MKFQYGNGIALPSKVGSFSENILKSSRTMPKTLWFYLPLRKWEKYQSSLGLEPLLWLLSNALYPLGQVKFLEMLIKSVSGL